MKASLIVLLMTTSSLSFSASKMECFKQISELETAAPIYSEVFENSSPLGFWKAISDNSFIAQIYLDLSNNKIGMVKTIDTMFGSTSVNENIELCIMSKRTFMKDSDGYHEYYLTDKNTMHVATDEFDVDDPEARSEFDFDTIKRAKVIFK